MKKDVTSEEKLLNLIRKKPAPATVKEVPPVSEGSRPAREKPKRPKEVTVVLNGSFRVVSVLGVGLLTYVVIMIFVIKDPRQVPTLGADLDSVRSLPSEVSLEIVNKSFEPYAEILQQRDLFKTAGMKNPGDLEGAGAALANVTPVIDLTADYRLVGIILEKNPQAIVEDIRNQQTLFLSRGDPLGPGIVEDIQAGKVVVQIQGQKVELVQ